MAALEEGAGLGRGLGLAGASGRGGRPALWAAPRSLGHPHPPEERGPAGPGGGGMEEAPGPVRGAPRRKHKMDEAPDDCPASKKRLAGVGLPPTTPAVPVQWAVCAGRPAGCGLADPCVRSLPGTPGVLEVPCEEMEQAAAGEQQCEAARRKLREIEDRITDEDEDGLVGEEPVGSLPTLILSDTLKAGLKRDYAGDLTKKIIESMSRPSMELVLWKPLPEFLTRKARSVSVKDYKPVAETCPAKSATLEAAFSLQTGKFSEPQQTEMPSPFYSTVEPAGCSEEEMEL